MKKNVVLVLVVALVFVIGVMIGGCAKKADASADISEKEEVELKLAAGAESLEGKTVYIVTPSTAFAASDKTVDMLGENTDEESSLFLKTVHHGDKKIDVKSGVTFVVNSEIVPSEKIGIFDIDGMSIEELESLYPEDYTEKIGEFESSYGMCIVLGK